MTRDCYVCIDFDGTCVTNDYPKVGDDIGADPYLRAATKLGAKLILHTMRSDDELCRAVDWFDNHGIELWEINQNPAQNSWSKSRKVWAHIYVDDSGVCAPMVLGNTHGRRREHLDWDQAGPWLLRMIAGILNQ